VSVEAEFTKGIVVQVEVGIDENYDLLEQKLDS